VTEKFASANPVIANAPLLPVVALSPAFGLGAASTTEIFAPATAIPDWLEMVPCSVYEMTPHASTKSAVVTSVPNVNGTFRLLDL